MRWICVTDKFDKFTYGKSYEGKSESKNLLNIPNDDGEYHLPAQWGYDGPDNFIEYFVTEERWQEIRKQKINKILGCPTEIQLRKALYKFKLNG